MAGLEDRRSTRGDRPRWSPGGLSDTASPALDRTDPWVGVVLDERFEILERIGQGGIATVYRAREHGLIHREVAIKLLSHTSSSSPDTVARFRNEAQALAEIHHPNVVHIHHVNRVPGGQLYIVMELLRGQNLLETLRGLAADGEALSWRRLAPMMLQVCAALQAVHVRDFIHRDIKPNNIFRVAVAGDPDFIKVLDFGIAKTEVELARADPASGPLTLPDRFLGTPHYAAPELIDLRHGWPIDGRVDMFALGVTMYQCLTGQLPFADLSDREVLYRTLHELPPRPSQRAPSRAISAEVDDLVMRAIARHPDDRFPDIAALAARIRSASLDRTAITVGAILDPTPGDEAATIRRTLPPRPAATRRVERDSHENTPRSSLLVGAPEPITDPAHPLPEPASQRDPRGTLVTFVLMGLCLVVLALLLGRELRKKPTPTQIKLSGLDDTAAPVVPGSPPNAPVVVVPPPADAGAGADADIILDDTIMKPAAAVSPAVERRRRKIAEIAAEVAAPRYLLECMIDITQRWRLQLVLSVAPTGKLLRASPGPRSSPELRLSDDEQQCLIRALGTLTFPGGTETQTVTTTIHGGPP